MTNRLSVCACHKQHGDTYTKTAPSRSVRQADVFVRLTRIDEILYFLDLTNDDVLIKLCI